jgi:hypothetical protein
MGLDTTHDCWHGAYSAFNRWRDKLGEVAGYTYHHDVHDLPEGTVMRSARKTPDIDWGNIERTIGRDLFGKWPAMPVRHDGTPDPLLVLLAHSDCEGEIQAEFCGPLADRLEELLPLLGDEDGGGHVGSYRGATEQFIAGLRSAVEQGESVDFR